MTVASPFSLPSEGPPQGSGGAAGALNVEGSLFDVDWLVVRAPAITRNTRVAVNELFFGRRQHSSRFCALVFHWRHRFADQSSGKLPSVAVAGNVAGIGAAVDSGGNAVDVRLVSLCACPACSPDMGVWSVSMVLLSGC